MAYLNLGARPGLKAREGELARLQTQYAELQQRQKLAAFELSDAELEAVLAAMRADVQSAEVAVARRALSLFVRVVDAERLVIWYHEPALVENARLQCVPMKCSCAMARSCSSMGRHLATKAWGVRAVGMAAMIPRFLPGRKAFVFCASIAC